MDLFNGYRLFPCTKENNLRTIKESGKTWGGGQRFHSHLQFAWEKRNPPEEKKKKKKWWQTQRREGSRAYPGGRGSKEALGLEKWTHLPRDMFLAGGYMCVKPHSSTVGGVESPEQEWEADFMLSASSEGLSLPHFRLSSGRICESSR